MMKKMMEIVMVALIVAGVAGAYFKWIGSLPISVTQTQKMSTFDVSGEGKVVVIPDEAIINMGVSDQGRSLKTVQQSINMKMEQVSKTLKGMGIDEKDIKTTAYNVYPDYQDKGLYRAQATVSVKMRDLDKVSDALDLISMIGLDSVNGPTFGLSDKLMEETMRQAREMAIDKAKTKAQELADLSGMKLGRIVNVAEGTQGGYPTPMYARDLTVSSTMEAKVATPIEKGSSEVTVTVTLSYETR